MNLCQSKVSLGCAERVALCALRCAMRGETRSCTALVCPFGLGRDGCDVQKLFADVWADEAPPAAWGTISLWNIGKTERRLLRGLAAAQTGNEALLERYLAYFAFAGRPHRRLIVAMEALAATLAVHGYWLQQPLDLLPLPASALALARVKGQDVAMAQISWPTP